MSENHYLTFVLRKMKEESTLSRKEGATFASGADDGSGIVARALLTLLEDEEWNRTHCNDPNFGLIIGRAIVGLATTALRATSENTRIELIALTTVKVNELVEAEDFQIHSHAVFARKLLSGEEPLTIQRY